MSITGHSTSSVFQRYNVRRDDVQRDALVTMEEYLSTKRGTASQPALLVVRATK